MQSRLQSKFLSDKMFQQLRWSMSRNVSKQPTLLSDEGLKQALLKHLRVEHLTRSISKTQ